MPKTVVKGDKVLVKLNDGISNIIVGAQRGGTLTITADTIEVTAKQDANKEFVPGRYSWTVDCDALVVVTDSARVLLESKILNGETVDVVFEVSDGTNTTTYSGTGIVTNYAITGSMDDVSTVSISIQGTGALSVS